MNDDAPIVEYGEPIDPKSIIEPTDPDTLELEPGHPGLGDAGYIQRRRELFALCRQHRLDELGPPLIDYTAEETRIWREVTPKLHELHLQYAGSIYLEAKNTLGISSREIPQLRSLSDRLRIPDGVVSPLTPRVPGGVGGGSGGGTGGVRLSPSTRLAPGVGLTPGIFRP